MQTAEAKIYYQNPWISVREGMSQPVIETRVATGVVALTPDLQVYLVGQYRYAMREYSWEIVEGGGDPSEAPLLTVQRELKEEAGLAADRWTPLGAPVQLSPPFSSEVGYLYLAEGLHEVGAEPEGTEELSVLRVPVAEAIARVRSGEIVDGMSIIALLRVERHLQGQGYVLQPNAAATSSPLPTYPDPWRCVSTATVYEDSHLHVREDQVIRPDGQPGIYGVVCAGPAVALMLRRDDGALLLQRRLRTTTGAALWELPSATGPRGVTPEVAAARIWQTLSDRETPNFSVVAERIQLTNCHASDRAYIFATASPADLAQPADGRWVSQAEAEALAERGEIADALSLIGLLRSA